MAAIYGHRWTSAYGERCDSDDGMLTIPGDTWRRGLSGVSEQRVGAGLDACVICADPWPPTLPQFRAMCFGIPSLAQVRLVFSGGAESTSFTRQMWQHVDAYRMKQADADKAERMLRDAYEITRERVMAMGELPAEPVAAITREEAKSTPTPADPATAKAHIDRIAEMLKTEPVTPHTEVDP
jgi:hypothetical protein